MLENMEKRLRADVLGVKNELRKDVTDIKKELQEVVVAINFTNAKFEELKNENTELKAQIKTLETRVSELEQKDSETHKLEDELKKMKMSQNELDQYSRNRNIEISGLEQKTGENVLQLVCKLAQELQIEGFQQDQIEKCHRVPSRHPDKINSIIVQFKARSDRDNWMKNKKRVVTNNQIIDSPSKSRVFVNEHLTPYFKALLWQTKQFAKKNNFKYVWVRNSKINMRKDENESAVRIVRSEEDLC